VSELGVLVDRAIMELCTRFDAGGYNPTPIIDLGVLVARADGKVDADERRALRDVFEALLDEQLPVDVVGHLISASLEVIEQAGPSARARLVAEILEDCDAVEEGLVVALAIAIASEGFSDAERAVVEQIADDANFPRAELAELVERVRATAGDRGSARDSLGVPPSKRTLEAAGPKPQR
jgi:tellurite resistance protein